MGIIRDCGSVVFATTFGKPAAAARAALVAFRGPAASAACSAAWTTRRARATRELASIGTGGRPGSVPARQRSRRAPVELGLMLGDLSRQVGPGLSQPVRTLGDPAAHRLTGL